MKTNDGDYNYVYVYAIEIMCLFMFILMVQVIVIDDVNVCEISILLVSAVLYWLSLALYESVLSILIIILIFSNLNLLNKLK